jgi:hypothetical protein
VTTWRDRLYLAWTGTDYRINLASSADGRVITGKRRLDHGGAVAFHPGKVAPFPPALAGSGARLWLAWRNGISSLKVCDAEHPHHPGPVTFEARIAGSLSLTATGTGGLTAAWTGADRHRRLYYLLTMTEDPSGGSLRMGASTRLDVAGSRSTPALCSHQGLLILAWTGTDGRINLLTMAADGPGPPVRLEETRSSGAPALCSHQGLLILAWTGTDLHINLASVQ